MLLVNCRAASAVSVDYTVNGLQYLRRRNNAESSHDSIGIFFANFGNQESPHSRSSSTTQRMCQLEPLEAIAPFRFLSYNIQHRVYQFCTFRIVAFGPIISSTTLTYDRTAKRHINILHATDGVARIKKRENNLGAKIALPCQLNKFTINKVVWSEKLTERRWSHGVHRTRLQIHQNSSRYIFATCESS